MKFTLRNLLAYLLAKYYLLTKAVVHANNHAFNGRYILSIYFHNPSKPLFIKCIQWLQQNNFQFLSVNDLKKISKENTQLPKGAVVITVDDGWQNNKNNIVAVAQQLNIPVALFVTTQPIETGEPFWWSIVKYAQKNKLYNGTVEALKKISNTQRVQIIQSLKNKISTLQRDALTINELNEIKKYTCVTIGSHTVSHPILTNCTNEQAFYEIAVSKNTLEQWLHQTIDSFAYPNGNVSEREINYLQQNNYQIAFSTQPTYLTKNALRNIFLLPRFEVLENVSFAENICRMSGVWYKRKQ